VTPHQKSKAVPSCRKGVDPPEKRSGKGKSRGGLENNKDGEMEKTHRKYMPGISRPIKNKRGKRPHRDKTAIRRERPAEKIPGGGKKPPAEDRKVQRNTA